jgi:hypothetical protein
MRLFQILESPIVSFAAIPDTTEDQVDDQTEDQDDPNKQGTIRTVKGAHLVYKRKDDATRYSELWIYKSNKLAKREDVVYTAILAGTDISKHSRKSPDGEQTVDVWSVGAPEDTLNFVQINGLSN